MKSKEDALKYIQQQEETDISFVKVGETSKHLVVSFGHNGHDGFAQKTSLVDLMFKRNDFDLMYFRNRAKWFLGGLKGIGKNITHTTAFLKKQFADYDKVICTGFSSGGYASILFGSLLEVNSVIAINPQTDLEFIHKSSQTHLTSLVRRCTKTYQAYHNLRAVLNEKVNYICWSDGDENLDGDEDFVLHCDHHLQNVQDFPTINKVTEGDIISELIILLDVVD